MEEESQKRTAYSPALSEGKLPEGAKDSATDFYWPELSNLATSTANGAGEI